MSKSANANHHSWILDLFLRARISRFISFSRRRIFVTKLIKHLPEITPSRRFFGKDSKQKWLDEMNFHHQNIDRASRVALAPIKNLGRYRFQTLDPFMLYLHSDKIAESLESFETFASRLLPAIQKDKDSESWSISREIFIHRRHWLALCTQVMNIVKLVGHFDEAEPGTLTWPGQERLSAAARRAAQAYGPFADPDSACPSLPRLSPRPHCRRHNAKRERLS